MTCECRHADPRACLEDLARREYPRLYVAPHLKCRCKCHEEVDLAQHLPATELARLRARIAAE